MYKFQFQVSTHRSHSYIDTHKFIHTHPSTYISKNIFVYTYAYFNYIVASGPVQEVRCTLKIKLVDLKAIRLVKLTFCVQSDKQCI